MVKECFGTMDCGTEEYDGCDVSDKCEEKANSRCGMCDEEVMKGQPMCEKCYNWLRFSP